MLFRVFTLGGRRSFQLQCTGRLRDEQAVLLQGKPKREEVLEVEGFRVGKAKEERKVEAAIMGEGKEWEERVGKGSLANSRSMMRKWSKPRGSQD